MNHAFENRKAGIFWMLATMFCFLTLDAVVKYTLQFYPLIEVTWARFFFATLIAAALAGRNLGAVTKSKQPRQQILRAMFLAATTGLFNLGVMSLPLTTATTIMFMTPVIVTMLSALVLGEIVGWRRWTSVGVGFGGALISMQIWQSGANHLNIAALVMLAAAFTNACYQIITRQLRFDNPQTTLLYSGAVGTAITSFVLPFVWQSPNLLGWGLFFASGLAGCMGHLCLIKAFNNAPATVVAPFGYSSLIWSSLFGFLIWQEIPKASTLIGAALIIAAGLYIFLREQKLQKSA